MDETEVVRYWERNAKAWTTLVRKSCDVRCDLINTPAFLAMLPEVRGRLGLDIGCGEGANTRRLAARGARMVALDIAPNFVAPARAAGAAALLAISYQVASARSGKPGGC